MNEEIMKNEEVINEVVNSSEEVIETVTESNPKGLKVAGGIGLALVVGVLTYKYAVKPIARKIKDRKVNKNTFDEEPEFTVVEDEIQKSEEDF